MRKVIAVIVISTLMLFCTVCVQGVAKQPVEKLIPTNIPEKFEKVKQDPKFPVVTIWYSVTGKGEQALNNMICWFNSTIGREKKIYVKGVYQGEYDRGYLNLIKALIPYDPENPNNQTNPNHLPDIAQLNSSLAGTAYYFDIKWFDGPPKKLLLLEDLLAAEKQMWVKDKLNPIAKAACSYKGKLLGLPFGSEMMGLYYNADAFKAAGLDPENPPKTMAEYAAAAGKLLIKDKTGNVKRYGAAGRLDVRLLSTWIPRMKDGCGGQFDMDDGRSGAPKVFIANQKDSLKRVLTEWKKLLGTGANDNGKYTNYEIRQQFENGAAAMYMASAVNMEGTLARFAAEKDKKMKFDARLARLPKLTAEDAPGQTIGGYGLYLFNNGDEARKKAAFEFIKFAASVDASAYFTATSGYYPTNTDAMNTKYMQDALKKNPHRKLSFDLLTEAASNTKAQEPFIPGSAVYNNLLGEEAVKMVTKYYDTFKVTAVEMAAGAIYKKANSVLKTYWEVHIYLPFPAYYG